MGTIEGKKIEVKDGDRINVDASGYKYTIIIKGAGIIVRGDDAILISPEASNSVEILLVETLV